MQRIYIFECGCEVECMNAKYMHIKHNAKIGCKKHRKPIEVCKFICDCGQVEYYKSPHQVSNRKTCSICAPKKYETQKNIRNPTIRIYECGCSTSGLPAHLYCPIHKQPIKLRKKVCISCNHEFIITNHKKCKKICPQCDFKKKEKKRNDISKDNEWQPKQRIDCKFYQECLEKSLKTNKRKHCMKCDKYKKTTLDIMDFLYADDSFDGFSLYI